ncbi:thioredoxin domain-containing protein [Deinococcus soli (ex Cha et al. 2016)]|uniref:Protein-disulfide isomerase n=2 Tax=Deinococcus soli (ex Cha et al. 2016) TaxID=1309411 RepID=A0ACC6KFU9_9DEIO|nr:thioredoxin domain-containing protein [Deinococcus soli (ex Cha et al. 2016)]MDR6218431.1 protein-disulfide isomerase [Deinococcus soli (ex Cha et al. 2016)]MDR6329171.1 protein-disulfide isomerase [Deinococcus soli (ex Cha et al. 2016)]MDR6751444.1 protein-disulfide isomerase [Deinococcus soli (ex Cha et al. 2016)]
MIGGTVAAFAAAGAAALFWFAQQPVEFDLTGQPMLGRATAPVQVVVFGDLKCPSCADFEKNVYPAVKAQAEAGQVAYYFLNMPFLAPDSRTAALAAECAAQQSPDAYYRVVETLYRAQGPEAEAWAARDRLPTLLKPAKIDVPAALACVDDGRAEHAVDADLAAARTARVNGTPTAFVNGKRLADISTLPQAAAAVSP